MIKRITILLLFIFSTCLLIINACKSSSSLAYNKQHFHRLSLFIPPGWPKPATDIFSNNPLTEEGFQLGRKLFYDGRLSKDGNFACASCHQQFAAFATYDHDLSHGFNNTFTTRNAPALFNLAWMKEFQWDGGVNHIEVQPLVPILAANEMNETLENILFKLKADTLYPSLFKAAFGDTTINSQRILKALAQFVGSIQSYNSKYDKVKRGEASFTISEQNGYTVFKTNCSVCHTEPLLTDNDFHNTGFPINKFLKDMGRMHITNDAKDSLKFKTPSLRNVALTFPYLHDGRLYTLTQVIEHYRSGINVSDASIDPILKKKIIISNVEKLDLVNFLNTLTDTVLISNKRYGPPVN